MCLATVASRGKLISRELFSVLWQILFLSPFPIELSLPARKFSFIWMFWSSITPCKYILDFTWYHCFKINKSLCCSYLIFVGHTHELLQSESSLGWVFASIPQCWDSLPMQHQGTILNTFHVILDSERVVHVYLGDKMCIFVPGCKRRRCKVQGNTNTL